MKAYSYARKITQIAVFTALSYVLYMFVKFPLPIFPSFLELQISDMPALLAGFMTGPIGGETVIIMRTLLKLPFTGTACVGELADFLIGTAFVLPSALFYKFHRTKKGALISLLIGIGSTTATAMLANRFILVPFYVTAFFGGNWDPLVNMIAALFPAATKETFYLFYIFLSVLPFNLLRGAICALITFLLYKKLVKLFDLIFPPQDKKNAKEEQTEQSEAEEQNAEKQNQDDGAQIEQENPENDDRIIE